MRLEVLHSLEEQAAWTFEVSLNILVLIVYMDLNHLIIIVHPSLDFGLSCRRFATVFHLLRLVEGLVVESGW